MFDSQKEGKIEKEKVRTILSTMIHNYDDLELDQLCDSEDAEGKPNDTHDKIITYLQYDLINALPLDEFNIK